MVRTGQWLSLAMVAVLAAGVTPRAGFAQETRPAPTAPTGPLTATQYLDQLATTLFSARLVQDRLEAAQRLLAIDTPGARDIITRGLSGNDRDTQIACARAIADQTALDPRWVDPLARLLPQRPPESVARALARYDGNPAAIEALIGFARSSQAAAVRAPAIRAMGQMVQKPVAETLVGLVSDSAQEPAVRAAAAEALTDLSGQTGNEQDARKWTQWWNARAGQAPAAWREQVIAEQHPLLEGSAERLRDQLRQFRQSVREQLDQIYQTQPPDTRTTTLLGYLNHTTPELRAAGAWIVSQAVNLGQPIRENVQRRLIELVGDASADVRLEAVRAIAKLSNPGALDAVITQSRVENDSEVKIAMCDALRSLGGQQAVAELQRLLRDPSARVAAAAAMALRGLAPTIQQNPPQAQQVVRDLQQVLAQRAAPKPDVLDPSTEELRAATVSALAPLVNFANPRAIFGQLSGLAQDGSPRVRKPALEGLGNLGPDAADVIAQELNRNNEPDPSVRSEAARALAKTGSKAHARYLDDSAAGTEEPNPTVRQQARMAFQSLLPTMSSRELNVWYQTFRRRNDTDDQIAVLRTLCAKLAEENSRADLAVQQQNLGTLYLQRNQPAQAIPYFQDALKYYQANNGGAQVPALISQLMNAYLQSKRYEEAIAFAEAQIGLDVANQGEVGPSIRNAAETLVKQGEKGDATSFSDAERLIRNALGMSQHPLAPNYRDDLEDIRRRIPGPPTTSPS